MNWAARHSPPDTGGVDATSRRSREASFDGADGVVGNGTLSKERIPKPSSIPTTPSAPLRWLRIFFLMAQPPLLYQEGSRQPYIRSHLHRPPLQMQGKSHFLCKARPTNTTCYNRRALVKKHILITTSPFGQNDRSALSLLDDDTIQYTLNPFHRRLRQEEIADLIGPYEVVIAGTEPITSAVLDRAPKLKLLAHTGIGLDNIDLAAARAREIAVTYTPSAPSPAVAELTIGQMIALLRKTSYADRRLRAGEWNRMIGRRLANVTVGVIGVGRVGRLVIEHLQGFKPNRVLANDLAPDDGFARRNGCVWADKETVLREADVITLHVPLTRQTHHLIGPKQLRMMKPDAILINT